MGWAWLELLREHSDVGAGLRSATRWSSCSPTSEWASLTAASAAEQGHRWAGFREPRRDRGSAPGMW